MLVLASILVIALAGSQQVPADAPPEVTQASGPRGTSGEAHEDVVGYAVPMRAAPAGQWSGVTVAVAHPTLPPGTAVELTALDTGRTIVALVVALEPGAIVALSPAAAQALGVGDHAAVRVRTIFANAQDQRALRSGQPAASRLDAPPALLAALRRKLPDQTVVAPPASPRAAVNHSVPVATRPPRTPPSSVQPSPRAEPVAPLRGGFVVQVAALSSPERAAALAQQLGGHVVRAGKLTRVQLGPFATAAQAQRARDGAARRGYADARISHTD